MPARRPTIKDVAAHAGVSKSLVSRAIRGTTGVSPKSRADINRAIRELGYRPNAAAQNLVEQRSRTIGVVVLGLHNPIAAEIMDGIQESVRLHGLHTMLVTGHDDPAIERAEIDKLMAFRVEGLILVGHRLPAGVAKAISPSCPAVLVGSEVLKVANLDTVSNDDLVGAKLAVDHLAALGHRYIAHVSGGDNDVAKLRQQGYMNAMASHRLKSLARCAPGNFSDEGGYRGTRTALEAAHTPTALFVANDIAAVGALAAVQDKGLAVPGDVSIVGYDGMALGALRSLSITTVAQPLRQMGILAAELLTERIEHPGSAAQHIKLAPTLVVRRTTGPLH